MSGYILSGYAWRAGARLNADAAKVGHEIDILRGDRDLLPRDELISAGVGGTGELAKCFTQDPSEAAQKRWQYEADYLTRHLIPVIVNTRTEDECQVEQRVWVPTFVETADNADRGVYRRVPISTLPPSEKPDRQMQAWIALMAWRDKYGDDPLFAPIIAAIDALKD